VTKGSGASEFSVYILRKQGLPPSELSENIRSQREVALARYLEGK